MFNNFKNILIGVLAAILVIALGASAYSALASGGADPLATPAPTVEGPVLPGGNGYGSGSGGASVLSIPASDLSVEESTALLFLREEEKLARDVYKALFTVWGEPIFENIAASEQMHMDEIKLLLDRYALADPAGAAGQFTDPNLQALYDQLVTQGSLSLTEALKVGAAIEEIDILDLQDRLAQSDNADIQLVFNNLLNGSANHLQAFTAALLRQTGEEYRPQYLTQEAYQTLLSGTNGNGNPGRTHGGDGSAGSNGNGNGNGASGGTFQSAGGGVPQANLSAASQVHGAVRSYDGTGMSLTLDDGTGLYVQLGSSRYNQSIGFAPQVGEALSVTGFPGDQGLYSAISVTLDDGRTFVFRDDAGRPLWSGGNGNRNGTGGRP